MWLPDPTGRFPERPFYQRDELDRECEKIMHGFLKSRNGKVSYPIETNDLVVLLEQESSDLDVWADLSSDGPDVEGKTTFSLKGKPTVEVIAELQEPHRENRLRTTLAHELGHVKLHNYLYRLHAGVPSPCCTHDTIIGASQVDWMEWQAGYCSGAFLMPLSVVRRTVREAKKGTGFSGQPDVATAEGQALIQQVRIAYQVSADAARVRLLQLGFVVE